MRSFSAASCVKYRKPTPWTIPETKYRFACFASLTNPRNCSRESYFLLCPPRSKENRSVLEVPDHRRKGQKLSRNSRRAVWAPRSRYDRLLVLGGTSGCFARD
jgi:hypothetical protein